MLNRLFGIAAVLLFASALIAGTTNYVHRMVVQDTYGSPPTCATATGDGELCVENDIEANGNLDIAGTATVGGAITLTGATTQTGDLTLNGGAGALTFGAASSSVVVPDNSATALDIGSTGLTNGIRYVSTDNLEYALFTAGTGNAAVSVTGTASLDASDCGKPIFVTAGIDTNTLTLPALSAVPAGCLYRIMYVGADGGALLDVSPNAADGIEGGCTLAASVVTFNGTDDNDIGLTKATGLTGDTISLIAGNADDWYVTSCQGIWANN